MKNKINNDIYNYVIENRMNELYNLERYKIKDDAYIPPIVWKGIIYIIDIMIDIMNIFLFKFVLYYLYLILTLIVFNLNLFYLKIKQL